MSSNNIRNLHAQSGPDPDEFWTFEDDFIFMMVMQDAKICTEFLRMVLPKEDFEEVKVYKQENPLFVDPSLSEGNFSVETQKTLKFQRDKHGVRLNALAKGAKAVVLHRDAELERT